MSRIIYQKIDQCADCLCLRWNVFHYVKKKARTETKEVKITPYCFLKTGPTKDAYSKDKSDFKGKITDDELRSFPEWCPLQDFEEPHEIKEINGKTIFPTEGDVVKP